jgi:molybdate transport system regulatory protein
MQKKTHPVKKRKSVPGMRGRIWIDGKEGTFLGYGRITLLERIRENGSITKAAKAMDMSYRHAWELIESMNRQASKPFVETATGGRKGGGTRLTEEGEKAVSLFREFNKDFSDFLKEEEKKLGKLLQEGRAK